MFSGTKVKCVLVITLSFVNIILLLHVTNHMAYKVMAYDDNHNIGVDSQCSSLLDEEFHFVSRQDMISHLRRDYPIYLFSLQGSQSTLIRLLLEYITTVYTGSIYRDDNLYDVGFEGQKRCRDVMIIEAFPTDIGIERREMKEIYKMPCLQRGKRIIKDVSEYVVWPNMAAIFLVRDPWETMFYRYIEAYGNSWRPKYFAQRWVNSNSNSWVDTLALMDVFDQNGYDYITIKYENLMDYENNPHMAVKEMEKLIKYMYKEEYYEQIKDIMIWRIKCVLGDLLPNKRDRFDKYDYYKTSLFNDESLHTAYSQTIDEFPMEICDAWRRMEFQAEQFNYTNLNYVSC